MTAEVDLCVVGGGPAGAAAALEAANDGLSVCLIDEGEQLGGQVWRARSEAILSAPATPESRAGDALRAAVAEADLMLKPATRVLQLTRRNESWDILTLTSKGTESLGARALILAAGAREYVQPVPGWTLPGVLGLAGATALFKQSLTPPGRLTLVSGTGPLVFYVAHEIRRLGGQVAAVVTPNSRNEWLRALPAMTAQPALLLRGVAWMADLAAGGVPILWRHAVTTVEGRDRVTGALCRPLSSDWAPDGAEVAFVADSLCLGHGLQPSIEAAQLAGVPVRHDNALGGWVPEASRTGRTAAAGLFLCGDGTGIRGVAAAVPQGKLAALEAAEWLGRPTDAARRRRLLACHSRAARFGAAMTALSVPRPGLMALTDSQTVVCRCESLTRAQIEAEIAAGAASIGAVKSGLRAGMGPCGGRYCQTVISRLIARGMLEGSVLPPTPRPPLRPAPVSALAGTFAYADLPIPKPAPL